jgi:hypothetical protein
MEETMEVLERPETFDPATHGEIAVMSSKGDTKIIWDRKQADEVSNARRTFDDLMKKGYAAFSVKGKDGDKGEQIKAFDPDAERMIMVPPLAGG